MVYYTYRLFEHSGWLYHFNCAVDRRWFHLLALASFVRWNKIIPWWNERTNINSNNSNNNEITNRIRNEKQLSAAILRRTPYAWITAREIIFENWVTCISIHKPSALQTADLEEFHIKTPKRTIILNDLYRIAVIAVQLQNERMERRNLNIQ